MISIMNVLFEVTHALQGAEKVADGEGLAFHSIPEMELIVDP